MTYFSFLILKIRRTQKQLPQHVRQNPTVLVVINLDRRIDPERDRNLFTLATRTMNHKRHILPRLDARLNPEQIKRLRAVEFQRSRTHIFSELARQHTHSDEVAAMNTLEALRNHGLHAEETCSLRRPVARAARA